MLQTFASQAALALDTARLYSREHEVASVLQQRILPEALCRSSPRSRPRASIEPAGRRGRDRRRLLRPVPRARRRIWFAIADVCGKGVVAATKTSMIKYSVRALVAAGLQARCSVLGEVNRMVAETGDASDIVTLWVGRLRSPTRHADVGERRTPAAACCDTRTARSSGSSRRARCSARLPDVMYGEETVQLGRGRRDSCSTRTG